MSGAAPARGAATPPGIGLVLGAYLLYAVGDATAKWLVGSISPWQVLFARSWLGLLLLALGGRATFDALRRLPDQRGLLGMNLANFGGWAAYYMAAVALPLPQLYTAYYLSPIVAALLAGPMLGERVGRAGWLAALLGFAGVLMTIAPWAGAAPASALGWPAACALASAALWGLASVLYRRNVHHSSPLVILLSSNLLIGTLSAAPALWHWQALDGPRAAELLGVAAAGLAAHWLYIHGLRRVPVGVAGPLGFSSLVWSVLLAYLVWGTMPGPGFYAGAALIVGAGLLGAGTPWRRRGRPDQAKMRST